MLNSCQNRLIRKRAYVPEHLPMYMHPFSESEAFFHLGLVYYQQQNRVNLIAYPLPGDLQGPDLQEHVRVLVRRLSPGDLKIISPVELEISSWKNIRIDRDFYYCLDLEDLKSGPKLRNMLRRAARDVRTSSVHEFTREHLQVLNSFLKQKNLDREKNLFFHRIPDYLAYSESALIIEARHREDHRLLAFNIMETGAWEYDFYLFNITWAESRKIPGINDLLLHEAILEASRAGKKFINMGLGINPGIAAFKTKWGGAPFLPYFFQHFRPAFSWKRIFRTG